MIKLKHWLSLVLIVVLAQGVNGQKPKQKELDSLEQILYNLDKNDTAAIVKLGEYIVANTDSDEKKYYALGVIVASYATKNEKNKSIQYLFRAKEVAERIGKPELIIKVYTTIASLYGSLNLHEKAKLYLNKSEKLVIAMPSGNGKSEIKAFLWNEWGNLYFGNKEYLKANNYYKKSLNGFRQMSGSGIVNSYYYRSSQYNYGRSFLQLNQPDSAIIELETALRLKDTVFPALSYTIKTDLAQAYADKSEHRRAIDTLLKIAQEPNPDILDLKSDVYLKLARSYKALGDLDNYTLFNEKHLALTNVTRSKDLDAINSVFDAEQESSLAKAKYTYNKWPIVFICALFLILAGLIFYIYRKRKKAYAATDIVKTDSHTPIAHPQIAHFGKKEDVAVTIPTVVEEELLAKLQEFEKSEIFVDPKLSIAQLSIQFNTNTTYLSEIINRSKGKNFNTYVNELRIAYICNKIVTDPAYLNYKISYLASACGFNSHSAFATVFKNIMGISPSDYLKEHQSQRNI